MATKYAMGKTVALKHDEALARATEALAKEGFGVLTEIDVAATLKKKLGVDVPPYRILGACNPQFAHRALQAEPEIGLLLPCNVIVYEEDARRSVVAAFDPEVMLAVIDNAQLREIATDAKERLRKAVDAV